MVAKLAYYSNLSDADSQRLVELYPNDAAQGAPYETGDSFQYTKMHKRLASFDGDAGVDSVRRFFTRQLSTQGDVWAYCEWAAEDHALGSKLTPISAQTTAGSTLTALVRYVPCSMYLTRVREPEVSA